MMGRRSGQQLDGRRGAVFCVRLTEDERDALERLMIARPGPRALGPWLKWNALASKSGRAVVPGPRGSTRPGAGQPAHAGNTRAPGEVLVIPRRRRVILDLCAGSGAWSAPYKRAGYRVVRVTLPQKDVRTFVAKGLRVWGIVAAPPCTEFSLVRNGSKKPRDFAGGMECVNAVLRIVQQTRPQWWALENPVGMLSQWLGTPRDVFDPCDFGDPWTKRTALWGSFALPSRGPFVRPIAGKTSLVRAAAERAVTPAGLRARLFQGEPMKTLEGAPRVDCPRCKTECVVTTRGPLEAHRCPHGFVCVGAQPRASNGFRRPRARCPLCPLENAKA